MLNLIALVAVSVMAVGAQEASTSALQCAGEYDLAKASVDFDLCKAVQQFALCIAKAPASKFVVVAEQKLAAVQEDLQFKLCDLRVNPSFHVVDREVRCFETGFPVGESLQYAYIETACGDGVKADNEIGINCGLEACGKKCQWLGDQGALEIDAVCDAHADCESENCDPTDGVCANAFYSCHEVKEADSEAKDGYYTISVDSNWRDWSKVVPDGTVEVLCHFYDGKAFALYEIVCSLVNDRGATFAFGIAMRPCMVVLFLRCKCSTTRYTFWGWGACVHVRVSGMYVCSRARVCPVCV
jgi:hypothetical protein